jgi:hypothetical protein
LLEWPFPDVDAGFAVLKVCVAQRCVQPGVVADKRQAVLQER